MERTAVRKMSESVFRMGLEDYTRPVAAGMC